MGSVAGSMGKNNYSSVFHIPKLFLFFLVLITSFFITFISAHVTVIQEDPIRIHKSKTNLKLKRSENVDLEFIKINAYT